MGEIKDEGDGLIKKLKQVNAQIVFVGNDVESKIVESFKENQITVIPSMS